MDLQPTQVRAGCLTSLCIAMDEAPFHGLLDTHDPADQPEVALAGVLARHSRRRQARMTVIAAAVVAVCGVSVGVGLTSSSAPQPTAGGGAEHHQGGTFSASGAVPLPAGLKYVSAPTSATGDTATGTPTSPVLPVNASGYSANVGLRENICTIFGCGVASISKVEPLGSRAVGDVTVQPYLISFKPVSGTGPEHPQAALPAAPACEQSGELVVRVSVGQKPLDEVTVPAATGVNEPFEALGEYLVRPASGRAVLIAIAEVQKSVASVSASFDGEPSERVTASHGWVVLVGRVPEATAAGDSVVMTALSADSRVLERALLPHPNEVGISSGTCAAKP